MLLQTGTHLLIIKIKITCFPCKTGDGRRHKVSSVCEQSECFRLCPGRGGRGPAGLQLVAVAQRGGCSRLIFNQRYEAAFPPKCFQFSSLLTVKTPDQLCVSTADSSLTRGQGCYRAAFTLRQLEPAGQTEHNSS